MLTQDVLNRLSFPSPSHSSLDLPINVHVLLLAQFDPFSVHGGIGILSPSFQDDPVQFSRRFVNILELWVRLEDREEGGFIEERGGVWYWFWF